MQFKFNWAYHVAKSELYCKEYPKLLSTFTKIIDGKLLSTGKCYATDRAGALFIDVIGDSLEEDLKMEQKNLRFFSILTDDSTDSVNLEEEVVYILRLKNDIPAVTFLSIQDAKNAHANGFLECITVAFSQFVKNVSDHILGKLWDASRLRSADKGKFSLIRFKIKCNLWQSRFSSISGSANALDCLFLKLTSLLHRDIREISPFLPSGNYVFK